MTLKSYHRGNHFILYLNNQKVISRNTPFTLQSNLQGMCVCTYLFGQRSNLPDDVASSFARGPCTQSHLFTQQSHGLKFEGHKPQSQPLHIQQRSVQVHFESCRLSRPERHHEGPVKKLLPSWIFSIST